VFSFEEKGVSPLSIEETKVAYNNCIILMFAG
jgi:hypothetical protein